MIGEDDRKQGEEDVQKLTDKYIEEIGEVGKAKKKRSWRFRRKYAADAGKEILKNPRALPSLWMATGVRLPHMPRMAGHRAGAENLRRIIRACVEFGVRYLTIYAFSTENWKRPQDEVSGLMQILAESIDRELTELHKQGVRLNHIGRLEHLDGQLRKKILEAMELTRNNERLTLNIAWNYGGRDEIVYAVQQIIKQGLDPEMVSEETISSHLFTSGIPDPDLVIRTSGEQRTSIFGLAERLRRMVLHPHPLA